MYFKFVNSHDDYCHNIIFYLYIFEKIKKKIKNTFLTCFDQLLVIL